MIFTSFSETFGNRKVQLINALFEHIHISILSLFIAILIAIPIGIYLSRKKIIPEYVIGTTAIFQTIPSLALLGILIPFVGIGKVPAVIALSISSRFCIIRR